MDPLLAAKVWHAWLAYFLFIPIALFILGTALLYVVRVKATRYPRR